MWISAKMVLLGFNIFNIFWNILSRDVFPIMRDPAVFADLIDVMTDHIQEKCKGVEIIVGLDARGFIFGPMIAQKLGIGFVPIRKKGKLPGEAITAKYTLEYGSVSFFI